MASSDFLGSFLITVFLISTSALALYGLHLYVLVFFFRRRHAAASSEQQAFLARYREETPESDWLGVTSQIPIYNEADVAIRVITAVAGMDYPGGKHTIQVLDDSTDETRLLVDRVVRPLREQGVDVEIIRRENREGFKAGALKVGLGRSRHPLVAIFDADFVPPRDFLRRATPFLARNAKVACIQGRWTYLNPHESWLTEAQSVGLDGHFAIEQGARAWNQLFMNFNGTAGVWRKAAIDDPAVGGWTADTLTEDLDLSYRAQLAGWKIEYCLSLECPSELPSTITALKAQQRRWTTGATQTAVKLLPRIWRSDARLSQKLEATFHLTHHTASLWMVFVALMTRPLILGVDPSAFLPAFLTGYTMMIITSLAPPTMYGYARRVLGGGWSGLKTTPAMMVIGTGMSINNALAVLRGLLTRGGEFVRTPKSGSTQRRKQASRYKTKSAPRLWIAEMLLGAYCLAYWVVCLSQGRLVFSVFLMVYAAGFLISGWMSRPSAPTIDRRRFITVSDGGETEMSPTLAPASAPVRAR
ncbi:MAG TPA: glycosyltransferase [Phycisphaerae bacterium]|nr:glycosyltransferase [Phycisphaerae bacterium]HRY71034.1 glycosyltransferase [Phycisphaerae bacterium]HSA29354.1 glycosyltransferase [Phycisphaerae bacterium]